LRWANVQAIDEYKGGRFLDTSVELFQTDDDEGSNKFEIILFHI